MRRADFGPARRCIAGTTSSALVARNAGNRLDFILTGDCDGDGCDDEAIWRSNADPAQVIFCIRPSLTPASPITLNLGLNGDYPVANSRRL